jgi:pyrroline-5-carboxylate reductase
MTKATTVAPNPLSPKKRRRRVSVGLILNLSIFCSCLAAASVALLTRQEGFLHRLYLTSVEGFQVKHSASCSSSSRAYYRGNQKHVHQRQPYIYPSNGAISHEKPQLPKVRRSTSSSVLLSTSSLDSSKNQHSRSDDNGGGASTTTDGLRVGFIGCGTIASAIINGMATQSTISIKSIVVTNRSESKSSVLAKTFPDLVDVVYDDGDNNSLQEIVDRSDIVFLTVLPEQALGVLRQVQLDPGRHSLVSLVSTSKLQDLIEASHLDPSRVSKMICLPSIARHQGVTLLCNTSIIGPTTATETAAVASEATDKSNCGIHCHTKILTDLLDAMGGVVVLPSESELEACMMTTCVMGPIYGMLQTSRDWLLDHTTTLSTEDASYLVIQQCIGALLDADRPRPIQPGDNDDNSNNITHTIMGTSKEDPYRLEELIAEQTPGGLNEQALSNFVTLGGVQGQRQVMDAILSRIRGQSDGSV